MNPEPKGSGTITDAKLIKERESWDAKAASAAVELAALQSQARLEEAERAATAAEPPRLPEPPSISPEAAELEKLRAERSKSITERKIASLESALAAANVLDKALGAELLEARGKLAFDDEGTFLLNREEIRGEMPGVNLAPAGVAGTGTRSPRSLGGGQGATGGLDLETIREAAQGRGPIPYIQVRKAFKEARKKGLL